MNNMNKMWCLLVLVCLSGCATIPAYEESLTFSGQPIDQVIAIAPLVAKLMVADQAINRQGFDEISTKYEIDITTPTLALFQAARAVLISYRRLAHNMMAARSIESIGLALQQSLFYPEINDCILE